jgi:hypothetical protein
MWWLSISDEEPHALPMLLLYSSIMRDATLASGSMRNVLQHCVHTIYMYNKYVYLLLLLLLF